MTTAAQWPAAGGGSGSVTVEAAEAEDRVGVPVFGAAGTVTSGTTPNYSDWVEPDENGNIVFQFTPTETVASLTGTLLVQLTSSPAADTAKLTTYAPKGWVIPPIAGTMSPIGLKVTNLARGTRARLKFTPATGTANLYADAS